MDTKPHAVIIGAGFTGCALAHDLALRGYRVTVLDRGEIASGTSGRTHGLLHSGGRYCVNDREAAIECIEENILLRKICKQCIEFNGGLFVALNDEDVAFGRDFEKGAADCGIPTEKLTGAEARKLEPELTPKVIMAFFVPDGSFDPLRLALAFAATARLNGAEFRPYHEVKKLIKEGSRITGVKVWNRHTSAEYDLHADILINATGAWAGHVAETAGLSVPVKPTPGVMVAFNKRLINRVVNRLALPGDGDIIIPQRRMGVIGTTSFEVTDADYIPVEADQTELMWERAVELVPALKNTEQRGVYMSARPLIGSSVQGRSLSRTFKCYDHQESEGIEGFVTITGGKATTCRAMAEKTADLVMKKMAYGSACSTRDVVLTSYRNYYRNAQGLHHD
jgi:glycerol-3-phosphate dehydrogenase